MLRVVLGFVNHVFEESGKKVESLEDFRDGIAIYRLISMLCDKIGIECTINRKRMSFRVRNKFQAVGNLNVIYHWLRQFSKISLVGISSIDIYDCNEKLTVAILFGIIEYFHINKGKRDKKMSDWINKIYSDDPSHDSSTIEKWGWESGGVLLRLIKNVFLGYNQFFDDEEKDDLLERCLEFAEKEMSIPKIVKIEDFKSPNKKVLFLYLSLFRDYEKRAKKEYDIRKLNSDLKERKIFLLEFSRQISGKTGIEISFSGTSFVVSKCFLFQRF